MSNQRFDESCRSCQAVRGLRPLTIVPRIFESAHWTVEHGHPTALRGWLVLTLKRHCRALHEVAPEEFDEFSCLLAAVCRGLGEILGAEKEYLTQFAEGEGFQHVHFHVIARLKDWPAHLRGPKVSAAIGGLVEQPLSRGELLPFALEMRTYLQSQPGVPPWNSNE